MCQGKKDCGLHEPQTKNKKNLNLGRTHIIKGNLMISSGRPSIESIIKLYVSSHRIESNLLPRGIDLILTGVSQPIAAPDTHMPNANCRLLTYYYYFSCQLFTFFFPHCGLFVAFRLNSFWGHIYLFTYSTAFVFLDVRRF